MLGPIDYTPLDGPEIVRSIFYPQRVWSPPPPRAEDHLVAVSPGVDVSARSYLLSSGAPSVLFFHGNGEIACQYDDVARLFAKAGANLFVADYRGYGRSGGSPSISTMMADAGPIFRYFREILAAGGHTGSLFVMGRSLGCHPAVEIAAGYQESLAGLIVESGTGHMARFVGRFGIPPDAPGLDVTLRRHAEKVASLALPLLVIHGEMDELIPLDAAVEFYDSVRSTDKRMEIIPGAGHNDVLWTGLEQYIGALGAFLRR